MTLHLEGRLLLPSSACWERAVPVRSGSLSLLVNMTCVKVAGRGPQSWGLCSPHHSSSFHPPAPVVEEEFYFSMGEKEARRISTNSSSRPPPRPALMAGREPWKNSKSDSFLLQKSAEKWPQHPIIIRCCSQ